MNKCMALDVVIGLPYRWAKLYAVVSIESSHAFLPVYVKAGGMLETL